jgi:alpha-1,3-rhamnosyl/mannosyltransferase
MTSPIIAMDIRMSYASGIGTYLRGLVPALRQLQSKSEELVFIEGKKKSTLAGQSRSVHVSAPMYSLREQILIPKASRALSAALLHSPHYNIPLMMAGQCVVTVHDLIHLKFPQFLRSPLAKAYAHFFFRHVIPRTRAILTVSEHTKKDLVEWLKIPARQITVAYPGVPDSFQLQSPDVITKTLKTFGLTKDYFLFVGNLKEFKNVQFLIKTYKVLAEKLTDCPPLVLVGRNFIPGFERELAAIPSVHWLHEVDPESLPALYGGALALVFPSLYEGFGFPPLEAMACGTPVICSQSASLPEVVGDAALFIDPTSVDSLLQAMTQLHQDSAMRQDLTAKGLVRATQFSWKTLAQKTFQVYRQCLN